MKGTDIPGTFRLEHIRAVVRAIHDQASTPAAIGDDTGISSRHVSFALHSARHLGWLTGDAEPGRVTAAGHELLGTPPGSSAEARLFQRGIEKCTVVQEIAPELLDTKTTVDFEDLTRRISELTGLAETSAMRSARVLLSWRRQALERAQSELTRRPGGPVLRLAALRVEGLGRLKAVQAELRPRDTLLAGRTASGKSTFLDGFALVSDALRHDIGRAVSNRAEGLEELLHMGRGDGDGGVAFAIAGWLPAEVRPEPQLVRIRYEVAIGWKKSQAGGRPGVRWEALFFRPQAGRASRTRTPANNMPRGWQPILGVNRDGRAWYRAEQSSWKTDYRLSSQQLALAALPEDLSRFPAATRFRQFLRRGLARVALDTAAMGQPCSPLATDSAALALDGSNLALVARNLERSDPPRFQQWLTHAQRALPELQDLKFVERSEDRHLYGVATLAGNDTPLPLRRLSAGALRALALTLLPFCGDPRVLHLVDEPGHGLDRTAAAAVQQAWSETDGGPQIVATTSSPLWAGLARPEQLLCFVPGDDGTTRIMPAKRYPDLDSLL